MTRDGGEGAVAGAGRWARSPLSRAALLGTLATSMIALGASQGGSPFSTKLDGAWFFGTGGPFSATSPAAGPAVLAVVGGIVLVVIAWCRLLLALRDRPGIPVAKLALVMGAWSLPLLVGPPLFSQDIYIYGALGAMVGHGMNPYHAGIEQLGSSPYLPLVDPLWLGSHSPYGPLFLAMTGIVAGLTGYHVLATVVGLRAVELIAICVLAGCVVGLAREHGRDPARVFALAMLNPVTVLDLIASGHNDPIMLALLAGGMLVAKRGRPALGIVLCTLAAAVKFPAGLGIVVIGWGWLGPGARWRDRVRPMVTAGLIGVGVMEVLARATGLGWGWLSTAGTPATVRTILDPPTALGMLGAAVSRAVGLGSSEHAILSVTRGAGEVAAVVVCLVLLRYSGRLGLLPVLGLGLLAVVVLGPVIQPWYFSWAIILLAPVATGRLRWLVVLLSVSAALLPLGVGAVVFSYLGVPAALGALVGLVVVLVPPALPLVPPAREALAAVREALYRSLGSRVAALGR